MGTAIVLGAGGLTGIAWHLGVISGLRDGGVDLRDAGLLVGTSAGAIAGALLASGMTPDEAQRFEARPGVTDPPIQPDWARGARAYQLLNDEEETRDPAEIRAEVGELALAAEVVDEEPYLTSLQRRLPGAAWPDRPMLITAVEAATGKPVTWDRDSGVPLDRAVAASCAVPCIFPPVTVAGSRYMDGAVRSNTNADLVGDADRVVVLAPLAPVRMRGSAAEVEELRRRAKVAFVSPDDEALGAFGDNPFDTDSWVPTLEAAVEQGRRVAPEVAAVWLG